MAEVLELKPIKYSEAKDTTDLAVFVRTSDEELTSWNRQRIVDALVRETYLDKDTAEIIAEEVVLPF